MSRRAPHIPQRLPVFVGCEGESEAGYVSLLSLFANQASLAVHIHIERLFPGAGDPLARVKRAVERLDHLKGRREPFKHLFILLDEDQVAGTPQRAEEARRLADRHNIVLIWQRPCHEALLLRHLPERQDRRPPNVTLSDRALVAEWSAYKKPMTRSELRERIDLEAVYRAAAVEPELASLLRVMGLTGYEA